MCGIPPSSTRTSVVFTARMLLWLSHAENTNKPRRSRRCSCGTTSLGSSLRTPNTWYGPSIRVSALGSRVATARYVGPGPAATVRRNRSMSSSVSGRVRPAVGHGLPGLRRDELRPIDANDVVLADVIAERMEERVRQPFRRRSRAPRTRGDRTGADTRCAASATSRPGLSPAGLTTRTCSGR